MAKIILVIFTAVLAAAVNADPDQGGCTCAVFPDNSPIPIIEQPLQYNVSCDKEGAEICQHLCVALAQGAKDKAPAMICEKLGTHVENLKVIREETEHRLHVGNRMRIFSTLVRGSISDRPAPTLQRRPDMEPRARLFVIWVACIQVGVFTKSCDNRDEWSFTGLKSPEPICCHEGKETFCDSKTDTSSLSSDKLQEKLE